jgi:hypothetical protein
MKRPEMHDITSFERVSLAELESPVVKQGAAYWRSLRGSRRFPAYEDLHPRDFAPILANTLLVKVVDGGADFEFRIAGEVQIQTFALPFAGKRLSELKDTSLAYNYVLKGLFGHVAEFREPVAVRGQLGPGFPNVRFGYFESIFLPLGAKDDAVDYLLGFSAYGPSGTR